MKRLFLCLAIFVSWSAFATQPPQPQDCDLILRQPPFGNLSGKVHFDDYDQVLQTFMNGEMANPASKLNHEEAQLRAADFHVFHQTFSYLKTINGFAGPIDFIGFKRFYKNTAGTSMKVLEGEVSVSSRGRRAQSIGLQTFKVGPENPLVSAQKPQAVAVLLTISEGRVLTFEEVKQMFAGKPITLDENYGLVMIDPVGPKYVVRAIVVADDFPGVASDPLISPFGPPQP